MTPYAWQVTLPRLGFACMAWLLSWLLRGLFMTLRPVYVQSQAARDVWYLGRPVMPTFWHGRMLYLLYLYHPYGSRITILVSQSRDGEFASRILQQFGVQATRGSSSRGGIRGLLALINKVRSGCHAGFASDGPRGPRGHVKPGVVLVAKKAGAVILPVTYNAQWRTVLRSWDGFLMPWPWSRIVVVCGEPIDLPANASDACCQAKRDEVEASLQRITALAEQYFSTNARCERVLTSP